MVIKKLAPHEAQKIAAGEVVERPANIIKELVENSIDAGATHITISVQEGGKTGITITDNGSGMDRDDALICFERHTTSKITAFDDLHTLTTFGFRGEALASICSVSKTTITTKTTTAPHALQLHIHAGTLVKEQPTAHATGTTIAITDLFYNVPARKKFLKTSATEWNQTSTLFKAFCVAYPAIHFILEHNNQTLYNCPGVTNLLDRTAQMVEPYVTKHLCNLVPQTDKHATITGVITAPQYHRYDRQSIYLLVNNRWVKNYELSKAVLKGYANVLQPNTYPYAVINITIDPLLVDINVHPKKEEVVFLHPRIIEQQVTAAVKATLEQQLSHQLQRPVTLAQPTNNNHQSHRALWAPHQPFAQTLEQLPPVFFKQPLHTDPVIPEQIHSNANAQHATPNIEQLPPAFTETQDSYLPVEEQSPYTLIGQFNTTYILVEHADGLMLIDQHAAHERILYEQYRQQFEHPETIHLLFPLTVTLSTDDRQLLVPHMALLEKHGFATDFLGDTTLLITATPVFAKTINMQELVYEIIGWIKESTDINPEDLFKKMTEKLRAQLACKAAIKAGDPLTQEKMQELLNTLTRTENRFSCPHGRPTQWLLSTRDIEKKFKRIT